MERQEAPLVAGLLRMEDALEHRDAFKRYAAFALAKLDEAHPNRVNLVPTKIIAELGEEISKQNVFLCERTLDWLVENGYFKCNSRRWSGDPNFAEHAYREARLTTLGFTALDAKIDFRGKSERAGDVLVEQVKAVASEARNAVIGEVVGQVIGGFTKSLMG